jgi:cyclopropane-fatty-acyl-phospholipid synthase
MGSDNTVTSTPDRPATIIARIHRLIVERTGVDLPVAIWDGRTRGPGDAGYRLVLPYPWSLRSLLLPPSDLRTGEAYVLGHVDIEGDVVAALHDLRRLAGALGPSDAMTLASALVRLPRPPARPSDRRARLTGRLHSQERDRAAIAFHYDLPHEFYRSFLDEGLVYSCAYFADPDEPLEAAQERKLDLVCRKLGVGPETRLLDIGCGWGSLLLHAATRYGARGLGVTLSATQAEVARERIAAAGLFDSVEVRLQDYRSLDGTFDAIASIGMVEHVGPERLGEYFTAVYRLLADDGRFLNHGITTGSRADAVRRGRRRDFIGSYVFPDGGLVPVWRMTREMERAGFEVVDLEQLRPHYALTLRSWVSRLESNLDVARSAASDVDVRIWRLYMAASAVNFEAGTLGVVQQLGTKGTALPFGRAWMLPQDPGG